MKFWQNIGKTFGNISGKFPLPPPPSQKNKREQFYVLQCANLTFLGNFDNTIGNLEFRRLKLY